jgi:hypothetical protein
VDILPVYIKDVPSPDDIIRAETLRHAAGIAKYKQDRLIAEALELQYLEPPVIKRDDFAAHCLSIKNSSID